MPKQWIDDPNTNRGLQAAIIAEQNDAFRKSACGYPNGEDVPEGKLLMTQGFSALGPAFQTVLLERVALFNDFTFENDPHGWHDFGEVDVNGTRVWFKFDLYDAAYEMGSDVPHDPAQTRRVLTLYLPEEH